MAVRVAFARNEGFFSYAHSVCYENIMSYDLFFCHRKAFGVGVWLPNDHQFSQSTNLHSCAKASLFITSEQNRCSSATALALNQHFHTANQSISTCPENTLYISSFKGQTSMCSLRQKRVAQKNLAQKKKKPLNLSAH